MTAPGRPGQPALAVRRGVFLATMVGAVLGAAAGAVVERGSLAGDTTIGGIIGAGLGAVVGRSAWIRVGIARAYGIHPAAMISILLARIVGSLLLGMVIIATLSSEGSRGTGTMSSRRTLSSFVVGLILLAATAIIEQRWLRRRPTARPE